MNEAKALRSELVRYLEREGIVLDAPARGSDYVVSPRSSREFVHRPVFSLPAELLAEYLRDMGARLQEEPDPLREALSLTQIHAAEYLGTDHGRGANATIALGFRRDRSGRVEFFVDQDVPRPPPPPGRSDGMVWSADRE